MMEELKSLRVFETHFGIDRNQTRMSLLMFTSPCSCNSTMTHTWVCGFRGVQDRDQADDACHGQRYGILACVYGPGRG
ncbi:hypothetical protein ACOSQ3_002833 [Xanthoceras sorbifolium]